MLVVVLFVSEMKAVAVTDICKSRMTNAVVKRLNAQGQTY